MRLRKRVEADFALTNSLGIRADFESGPLNLEEMYNVFPFENTIVVMFLSGVEIEETLEMVYEPYLLRLGFIERSLRGRMLTAKGREYLKRG